MDPSSPAGILSALIRDDKQSNFVWSNKIHSETRDSLERTRGGCHMSPLTQRRFHYNSQDPNVDDNKCGGNKKVTWDELVHVRQFQPFVEELKDRDGNGIFGKMQLSRFNYT